MSNSNVVVVTGVSSGIGRTAAERFVKRGFRVFGTARNTAKAQPMTGVELVEMDIPRRRWGRESRPSSARPRVIHLWPKAADLAALDTRLAAGWKFG